MKSSASKIQLAGFDDLFQTGGEAEASDERVQEIPLSELFPFKNHPFQVRDDEATIIMVDSNLQREKILPSEEAFAYKMELEALKHQSKRRDLTCERGVHKLKSRDKVVQDAGERCGLTVTRYISLTELIPSLLALVDEDKLSSAPPQTISPS